MKVTTKKVVELSEEEVRQAIRDYIEAHQNFRPVVVNFHIAIVPYDETGIHKLIGATAQQ